MNPINVITFTRKPVDGKTPIIESYKKNTTVMIIV